jgi:hypothetical protein
MTASAVWSVLLERRRPLFGPLMNKTNIRFYQVLFHFMASASPGLPVSQVIILMAE